MLEAFGGLGTAAKIKMASKKEPSKLFLWVSREEVRVHALEALAHTGPQTESVETLSALVEALGGVNRGIVLLDSGIIQQYGPTIYGRIRAACRGCRIIILCALDSRGLIREAMEAGVYGCVIEPYPPWEIQTMVRHILADFDHELSATAKIVPKAKEAQRTSQS